MAIYFAKYGAAATAKAYQHRVPPEWSHAELVCTSCAEEYEHDLDECPSCGSPDANVIGRGSAGRFWGYRGLQRSLAIREVTPSVGLAAGRIARRWYRAKARSYNGTGRSESAPSARSYARTSACSPMLADSFASTTAPPLTHSLPEHCDKRSIPRTRPNSIGTIQSPWTIDTVGRDASRVVNVRTRPSLGRELPGRCRLIAITTPFGLFWPIPTSSIFSLSITG